MIGLLQTVPAASASSSQFWQFNILDLLLFLSGVAIAIFTFSRWWNGYVNPLRGHYLSVEDTIRPESMQEFGVVGIPFGETRFLFAIRPRRGLLLESIYPVFYMRSWAPWRRGQRMPNDQLSVTNVERHMGGTTFTPMSKDSTDPNAPRWNDLSHLRRGKRQIFQFTVQANRQFESFNGKLSIQFQFEYRDEPDQRIVRRGLFVKELPRQVPLNRWITKLRGKVLVT